MTDAKGLKEAIKQYKTQLSQVNITLSTMPKGLDRDNLLNLKSDIEELIFLTKESLQNLERNVEYNIEDSDDPDDFLDKECVLLKTKQKKSSDDEDKQDNITVSASDSIKDELKELEGMKCKAPYDNVWGIGYHNAMICSIYRKKDEITKDIHDIKVRVFYLNPTHKEMIPCSYFLDGNCKFSDEICHYSHGEIVPFLSLQEYKEPNFHNIKIGSRVLTKQKNMWHKSIVLRLPEEDEDKYRVKFEAGGKIIEASVQDILPLDETDLQISDTSNDSDENNKDIDNDFEPNSSYINNQLVHKSLLTLSSKEPLGNWEKYTRGIGSKLMMQMGYVFGTGLGKLSNGRIEPVEARVLPAGKSLDHCMELREFADDDKDLFSAERNMRKQKLQQQRKRQYQREKRNKDSNVFNFINKALSNGPEHYTDSSQNKNKLKTKSNRNLNVASFQIGENINRLERESLKLKELLGRHAKNSTFYNSIAIKYNEKQRELTDLRASEKNITAEQNQRKNKAKLSIF